MSEIPHGACLNHTICRVTRLLDIVLQAFADHFILAGEAVLSVVGVQGRVICDVAAEGKGVGECTKILVVLHPI